MYFNYQQQKLKHYGQAETRRQQCSNDSERKAALLATSAVVIPAAEGGECVCGGGDGSKCSCAGQGGQSGYSKSIKVACTAKRVACCGVSACSVGLGAPAGGVGRVALSCKQREQPNSPE